MSSLVILLLYNIQNSCQEPGLSLPSLKVMAGAAGFLRLFLDSGLEDYMHKVIKNKKMYSSIYKKDFKYKETTEKIIGCAMKVHRKLGNGFQEVIYQRALEKEFFDNKIRFEREKDMDVMYDGEKLGTRRVDFLVDGKISIELKALAVLENTQLAQAKNYLEVYNLEVGLLINFGAKSLEVKRIFNNKYKP